MEQDDPDWPVASAERKARGSNFGAVQAEREANPRKGLLLNSTHIVNGTEQIQY